MNSLWLMSQELLKNGIRVRYAETDDLGVIGIVPKDDPNIPGYSFRIWLEREQWVLGVLDPWPYETILKTSQDVKAVIQFAIEIYTAPKPQDTNRQVPIRSLIEYFNQPPFEVYRYDDQSILGYAHDKRYEFAIVREAQTWFAIMINKNALTPTQLIGYSSDLPEVLEIVRTAVNKGE